jgi:serine protease Do
MSDENGTNFSEPAKTESEEKTVVETPVEEPKAEEPKVEEKPAEVPAETPAEEPKVEAKKPGTKEPVNSAFFIAMLALICGIGALCFTGAQYFEAHNQQEVTVLPATQDGNSVSFKEGSVADIVSKVAPGVVSITTEVRTQSWFGEESSTAAGTGFIVTKDGYVVTNKHVVSDARTVNIVLDDGTEYEDVQVVGTDPLNDLAILKIKGADNLPAVTLGTSTTLSAGQQVVAIGNALGLYSNTVTSGVISGKGRSLVATDQSRSSYEQLSDMIQTDAAINGGNSGGPLINAAGQVIGINTAYASDGNGVGFAIPISAVKGLIRHAIETNKVERAVIGVQYINITPGVAKEEKLDVKAGAYIKDEDGIVKDGPADKAGLKEGDIITAVNDVKIGSAGSLSTLVGEYTVGETVKITFIRDGKEITANMTLSAYKK